MNDLAEYIEEFFITNQIKKVDIADRLKISKQRLNQILNKKGFTIEDANYLLNPFGYCLDYHITKIVPIVTKSNYLKKIANTNIEIESIHYTTNDRLLAYLKAFLQKQNISNKEVAEKLNMSPQTYQHFINKKSFSLADLKKITDIIDYDITINFSEKHNEQNRQG